VPEKVVTQLKKWNNLAQNNNTNQNSDVDVADLLAKITIGNENLDQLKLLIQNANQEQGVFPKIFRLRSLITERDNLKSLSYRIIPGTVAKVTKEDIEKILELVDVEIHPLQVELDALNLKTEIEYSPKAA